MFSLDFIRTNELFTDTPKPFQNYSVIVNKSSKTNRIFYET